MRQTHPAWWAQQGEEGRGRTVFPEAVSSCDLTLEKELAVQITGNGQMEHCVLGLSKVARFGKQKIKI